MPIDPELADELVATVRAFVVKDVLPVASDLEHADEYPTELVTQMRALGLFGATLRKILYQRSIELKEADETIGLRLTKPAGDFSTTVLGNVLEALITIKGKQPKL